MPQLWLSPLRGARSERRPARAALARSAHRLRPQHHRAGAAPPSARAAAACSGSRSRTRALRASEADLLVVPRHDPAQGDNVFPTLGAVHRVTPARLAEGARRFAPRCRRPAAAAGRGADRRQQPCLSPDAGAFRGARRPARRAWPRSGFGLADHAVAAHRRARRADLLAERLAGLPAFIWDGSGDNPYFGMLGLADAIVVTADSVSMVSEAAATGKPVHIVELEGGSAQIRALPCTRCATAGITRPFRGEIEHWRYAPPDDTARAAAAIRGRFAGRLAEVA